MYDDLIGLAKTIADLDPKKPRQANLRRAVSTAYYAVFHYSRIIHTKILRFVEPTRDSLRLIDI